MTTDTSERDDTMIQVERLSKVYRGGIEAVKDLTFSVRRGEVFGLLGPNGAGKSTTIGMLTTTVTPTSGRAWLAGFDIAREPRAARQVSSVVFQDAVVDKGLTGRFNLELHARLWGVSTIVAASRIALIVETLGLTELLNRPAGSFSGGQRRRLEIGRALISNPQVLFLDEPTVGLDTRIRYELLDVLSRLRTESEMTTVLTTHYLDEAERLCDRIAIVSAGRIVALDTPARLLATLGRELLELRVSSNPGPTLQTLQQRRIAGDDAFAVGSTLTVPLHGSSATAAIAAIGELGLPTTAVISRPPTLDDVYLHLTGDLLAA